MIYAIAAFLGSIFLAGLIHIIAILSVPYLASDTVWNDLAVALPVTRAEVLAAPSPSSTQLGTLDPATVVAACRFDLRDGPLAISAPTSASQWMLTIHAPNGAVIYGVTSETELIGGLELELRTEAQERGLIISDAPDERLRIRSSHREGFVLFRMLAVQPSQRPPLERLARRVRCQTLPDRI